MSGRQVFSSAHKCALFTKLTNPTLELESAAFLETENFSPSLGEEQNSADSIIENDDFISEHCQVNKAATHDRPLSLPWDDAMVGSVVHGSLDYLLSDTMRSVGAEEEQQ